MVSLASLIRVKRNQGRRWANMRPETKKGSLERGAASKGAAVNLIPSIWLESSLVLHNLMKVVFV